MGVTIDMITGWVNANYGLIIFTSLILFLVGMHWMNKYNKKKRQKQLDVPPLMPTSDVLQEQSFTDEFDLFEDIQAKDTLTSFKDQKAKIEKKLKQIREEAKKVVGQEKQGDYEYRQRKFQFGNERKRLALNYNNYMHQSRIIDEMIQNQIRLQEEFKKEDGSKQRDEKGRYI